MNKNVLLSIILVLSLSSCIAQEWGWVTDKADENTAEDRVVWPQWEGVENKASSSNVWTDGWESISSGQR